MAVALLAPDSLGEPAPRDGVRIHCKAPEVCEGLGEIQGPGDSRAGRGRQKNSCSASCRQGWPCFINPLETTVLNPVLSFPHCLTAAGEHQDLAVQCVPCGDRCELGFRLRTSSGWVLGLGQALAIYHLRGSTGSPFTVYWIVNTGRLHLEFGSETQFLRQVVLWCLSDG